MHWATFNHSEIHHKWIAESFALEKTFKISLILTVTPLDHVPKHHTQEKMTGNVKNLHDFLDRVFCDKAHGSTYLCVFFDVTNTSPDSSWAPFHSHTCLLSHHLPLENENACCWGYLVCWGDFQEFGTGKLPIRSKIKRYSQKPAKYHVASSVCISSSYHSPKQSCFLLLK